MPENAGQHDLTWLMFCAITVCGFGMYGVLLHTGQSNMGDPVNGRYKAFLWVGVAYFLVAIVAPSLILISKGASFSVPVKGALWSLAAGAAGAVGAFGILLAFGAGGLPSVVMSIVFAGAPIVNACIALSVHPPAHRPDWRFFIGIALAAIGGCLVTLYKPPPAKHAPPSPPLVSEELPS